MYRSTLITIACMMAAITPVNGADSTGVGSGLSHPGYSPAAGVRVGDSVSGVPMQIGASACSNLPSHQRPNAPLKLISFAVDDSSRLNAVYGLEQSTQSGNVYMCTDSTVTHTRQNWMIAYNGTAWSQCLYNTASHQTFHKGSNNCSE